LDSSGDAVEKMGFSGSDADLEVQFRAQDLDGNCLIS
jgi:hypothetical protein